MVKCWQFYLVHPLGAKGQEEKNRECPNTCHVCRFHLLLEVLWLTQRGAACVRCTTVWTNCLLCVCRRRAPLCDHCQVINGKWAHISCRAFRRHQFKVKANNLSLPGGRFIFTYLLPVLVSPFRLPTPSPSNTVPGSASAVHPRHLVSICQRNRLCGGCTICDIHLYCRVSE